MANTKLEIVERMLRSDDCRNRLHTGGVVHLEIGCERPAMMTSSSPSNASNLKRMSLPSIETELRSDRAWEEAVRKCEIQAESVGAISILRSSSPSDLKRYLEDTRRQYESKKLSKLMNAVEGCLDVIARHEKAIDMLAQAGGAPGCIAWGCIRLVLESAQGNVKDYSRLLAALADISTWLGPIELEADTFSLSPLVTQSLVSLYVTIIQFWTRAYAVFSGSRFRRALGAFRAIWSDYDVEYATLRTGFDKALQLFMASTSAESHRQVNTLTEKFDNAFVISVQSEEHRSTLQWLSPADSFPFGLDFYQQAYEERLDKRLPGTCEWMFKQEQFLSWENAFPQSPQSLFWLTAIPGAGKSVLTASVTSHCIDMNSQQTFYYYFDASQTYTTQCISMGKCLLYQLYSQSRQTGKTSHIELRDIIEQSGSANAKSFQPVWDLVVSYVTQLSSPIIVIDALDECNEPSRLLRALKQLIKATSARIFVSSREAMPDIVPDSTLSLASLPAADIAAYVQHRTNSGVMSSPAIRPKIVQALTAKHENMFLWVKLVLDELDSGYSIAAMEAALEDLPAGLQGLYTTILQKLDSNTKKPQQDFRRTVLTWLCCARRNLSIQELCLALQTDLAEQGFLFTEETLQANIQAVCGPLITFDNGYLQLLHLSLKDFLITSLVSDSSSRWHVDLREGNWQLLKSCISILTSILAPEKTTEHLGAVSALLEYSAESWLHHARLSLPIDDTTAQPLYQFLRSRASLAWLSFKLANGAYLPDDILWLLSLIENTSGVSQSMTRWCQFITRILTDYSEVLRGDASALYSLDFAHIARETDFSTAWLSTSKVIERDMLKDDFVLRTYQSIPPRRRLQANVTDFETYGEEQLGLFCKLEKYDAYVYARRTVQNNRLRLHIQSCRDGMQLSPIVINLETYELDDSGPLRVRDFLISSDESRIAFACGRGQHFYIGVWQFRAALSFSIKHVDKPWADEVFQIWTQSRMFKKSPQVLSFVGQYLYCPAGRVDLRSGTVATSPMKYLPDDDASSGGPDWEEEEAGARVAILFAKGEAATLPLVPNRDSLDQAYRYTADGSLLREYPLPALRFGFRRYHLPVAADPSGRFLIWHISRMKDEDTAVLDLQSGNELDLGEATTGSRGYNFNLHAALFTPAGLLVTASSAPGGLYITCWAMSGNARSAACSRITQRNYRDDFSGMCLSKDGSVLHLVMRSQLITTLTVPTLEEIDKYLGYTGDLESVVKTLPSIDGRSIARLRWDPSNFRLRVWNSQGQISRDFTYPQYTPKLEDLLISPTLDWIAVQRSYGLLLYEVPGSPSSTPGQTAASLPPGDKTAEDESISDHDSDVDYRKNGRSKTLDLLFDYIDSGDLSEEAAYASYASPCGRHIVLVVHPACSTPKNRLRLFSNISAISTTDAVKDVPAVRFPSHEREIQNLEILPFDNSKIVVNFAREEALCYLTCWTALTAGNVIAKVEQFVFDMRELTLRRIVSGYTEVQIDSSRARDLAGLQVSDNAPARSQPRLDQSAILSRCEQYLVLSASVGLEHCQWLERLSNVSDALDANPRLISVDKVYWKEHRYWVELVNQRILLRRSVRDREGDSGLFSALSCHVELGIVPIGQAKSQVWLMIPKANDEQMSILIASEHVATEVWTIQESWNDVVGKLDKLERQHQAAIDNLGGIR